MNWTPIIIFATSWIILGLFSFITLYIIAHKEAKYENRLKKFDDYMEKTFPLIFKLSFLLLPLGFVLALSLLLTFIYHKYIVKDIEK